MTVKTIDGYPSKDFLRIRETLLKKQRESLLAHYDAVKEELSRCDHELQTISSIKLMYDMDDEKSKTLEDTRNRGGL